MKDCWKNRVYGDIEDAFDSLRCRESVFEMYRSDERLVVTRTRASEVMRNGDWLMGFELLYPETCTLNLYVEDQLLGTLELCQDAPVAAIRNNFPLPMYVVDGSISVRLQENSQDIQDVVVRPIYASVSCGIRLNMKMWGATGEGWSFVMFMIICDQGISEDSLEFFLPRLSPPLTCDEEMQRHRAWMNDTGLRAELLEKALHPDRREWWLDVEQRKSRQWGAPPADVL
jgi:hypothetical protein